MGGHLFVSVMMKLQLARLSLGLFTLTLLLAFLPACTTVVEKPVPVQTTTQTTETTTVRRPGVTESTTTRTY